MKTVDFIASFQTQTQVCIDDVLNIAGFLHCQID